MDKIKHHITIFDLYTRNYCE